MPRIPPISIVVALYLGGLLLGFSAMGSVPALLIGGAAFAVAAVHRHPATVLGIFVLAGFSVARSTTATAACPERNPDVIIGIVLEGDAAPGRFVRGHHLDCEPPVALLVRRGSAPAGSTVQITGAGSLSSEGTVVRDAVVTVTGEAPFFAHMRALAGEHIDRAFGRDAALARALLIADMHGLSPELRDRFAVSGLAHMLSISGLHVAIIAIAMELVLGLVRVPARFAHLLSLGIIVLYVIMLGAPPPAVRSAAMLAVRAISRVAQRPTSPWAILTLGALQPIVSPRTVMDLGFQLSVIGVAALIVGGVLVRRLRVPAHPSWRRAAVTGAICSTIATVASAPLVLWFFGRVSLVGPLSNLVADPIVAVLQPMLFFSLVLSPFPAAAAFVADAAHPLLAALDGVAALCAAIPGASLVGYPTTATAVLAAVACAAVLLACLHERPLRPLGVAAATCAAIAWSSALPSSSGMAELHMIDVGQGDAIALRSPHGHWVVFDAGRAWRGGDAGRSTIIPYLSRRGGTVDLFILSHPHTDHVGGAASLLRALRPARYLDAAFAAPNDAYLASLQAARTEHLAWARVHPGDSLSIDGMEITFLAPDSAWTASLPDPNNASTVALVRIGEIRMLLVGDAEAPEEDWLLERYQNRLRADVLKVGHHGSATSSTPRFLDAVAPRLALISVGAGNTYGHPSASVIDDLLAHHAQTLRTDLSGSIVVRTDGRRVLVEAGGLEWALPPRPDGRQ